MIEWCKKAGWSYRLRLKGNLKVCLEREGSESKVNSLKVGDYQNVTLTEQRICTNLGIIHEAGHPESWIIAMDCSPNGYKTLDYGLRWGIESLFSDFKTRGFGLEDTQMRIPANLERLILVLSIALYWAISIGLWHQKEHPQRLSQKQKKISKLSLFKIGMRYLRIALTLASPLIPLLWTSLP